MRRAIKMANSKKMPEGKYGPYIVTEFYDKFELPKERAWEKVIMGRGLLNGKPRTMEHMVWMDSNVGIPPHIHPFPELLSYYGSDMDHPDELYCDVEFWLEDEKYVFNKSFVVYIPENVTHCPLHMRNMTKPIFHFTMGPGLEYNT
jgi:hypothetical protein